jgi:hypothetical protein
MEEKVVLGIVVNELTKLPAPIKMQGLIQRVAPIPVSFSRSDWVF